MAKPTSTYMRVRMMVFHSFLGMSAVRLLRSCSTCFLLSAAFFSRASAARYHVLVMSKQRGPR